MEWTRLHDIRRREIFDRYHPAGTDWWVAYDPDHPDDRREANHPLVQVIAGEVVGTCRLDLLPGRRAALRLVAVEPGRRGLGLGAALVEGAEQLAAEQGATLGCLNAQPAVAAFYGRLGWAAAPWEGRSSCPRSLPMCKRLAPAGYLGLAGAAAARAAGPAAAAA